MVFTKAVAGSSRVVGSVVGVIVDSFESRQMLGACTGLAATKVSVALRVWVWQYCIHSNDFWSAEKDAGTALPGCATSSFCCLGFGGGSGASSDSASVAMRSS